MLKTWRRVRNYVKYDLREIIAPSSLPYPPGEKPPENTWKEFFQILRLATRDYLDTWKPEKPKPAQETEEQAEPQEPPIAEELAGVARSGAESVKPILQELYRTRAASYHEAVNSFVQGYREGFAGLPDNEDESDEAPSSSPDQARPLAQWAGESVMSMPEARPPAKGADVPSAEPSDRARPPHRGADESPVSLSDQARPAPEEGEGSSAAGKEAVAGKEALQEKPGKDAGGGAVMGREASNGKNA